MYYNDRRDEYEFFDRSDRCFAKYSPQIHGVTLFLTGDNGLSLHHYIEITSYFREAFRNAGFIYEQPKMGSGFLMFPINQSNRSALYDLYAEIPLILCGLPGIDNDELKNFYDVVHLHLYPACTQLAS
jgi:hypothetical protein